MFPNPRIAASACLMGKPTRYDGGNKKSHILACQVSKVFELISVCPEVDIGLPTPRNPVALVQNFDVRLIGTIDNDKDITNEIVNYSRRFARQNAIICGLIVKASSPSCGYKSATVYRKSGKSRYGVNGLFTSAFLAAKPWVPIIDENDLQNLDMRIFFIEAALALHDFLSLAKSHINSETLRQFHDRQRLFVASRSQRAQSALDKALLNNGTVQGKFKATKMLFLKTVKRRPTKKKQAKAMLGSLKTIKGKLAPAAYNKVSAMIARYGRGKTFNYPDVLESLKLVTLESGDALLKSQSCLNYSKPVLNLLKLI
jgi:uncharacterized protein YbbK (DUF523 family)/uncharacterized protein YbgA (DUF1722 family)